ncbi:hypothetical protein KFF05_00695 [bacterium SCSIO 12827]|nr:hypothetical protein KFF05_00695 [bacterium SCSIO 12827]
MPVASGVGAVRIKYRHIVLRFLLIAFPAYLAALLLLHIPTGFELRNVYFSFSSYAEASIQGALALFILTICAFFLPGLWRPALLIDREGISFGVTLIKPKKILWDEIKAIKTDGHRLLIAIGSTVSKAPRNNGVVQFNVSGFWPISASTLQNLISTKAEELGGVAVFIDDEETNFTEKYAVLTTHVRPPWTKAVGYTFAAAIFVLAVGTYYDGVKTHHALNERFYRKLDETLAAYRQGHIEYALSRLELMQRKIQISGKGSHFISPKNLNNDARCVMAFLKKSSSSTGEERTLSTQLAIEICRLSEKLP